MDWTKMRPWLPLVGLVPVAWLSLYIMFWLDRADCAEPVAACLGNGFGNWAGDVVMFDWMDTTLAAGLLAFGAGAFVYITARNQRADALHDRFSETRSRRIAIMKAASLSMHSFRASSLRGQWDLARRHIDALLQGAERIGEFDLLGSAWIHGIALELRRGLPVPNAVDTEHNRQVRAVARILAGDAQVFFRDPERYFDQAGNFTFVPTKVPRVEALHHLVHPVLESNHHAAPSS